MSQKGRREFLTSAGAVAAALAACAAPVRRAQAQPPTCVTMYDENDIVHKVAPLLQNIPSGLITFPAGTPLTMDTLLHNPLYVGNTLAALAHQPKPDITTVIVKRGTNVPLGTYKLIPLGTTPPPPFQRSPAVLTMTQANSFTPDWTRILMFVIPDHLGHTPGEAESAMCVHPFGM